MNDTVSHHHISLDYTSSKKKKKNNTSKPLQ
ncbi:hypothetical protein OIU77_018452, partial [Salix suchowensis]